MSYFKLLLNTGKSIFPYPIIIFLNYIITFIVFPNLTINKKYEGLEFVWSSLLFIFVYNVGDFIGKLICDYRWTFNSYSVIYTFVTRSYFIVAIPLLATSIFDDDSLINNYFYPYLVQFLFSITNGVVTSNFFYKCRFIVYQIIRNMSTQVQEVRRCPRWNHAPNWNPHRNQHCHPILQTLCLCRVMIHLFSNPILHQNIKTYKNIT